MSVRVWKDGSHGDIPPARLAMPGIRKYLYKSLILLASRRLVVVEK